MVVCCRQALLCSCFVPGYCGMQPPSFGGAVSVYSNNTHTTQFGRRGHQHDLVSHVSQCYMDGGFSCFQPVLPSQTLTVCPFSGDTDICPADRPCMWDLVVSGATLKGNVANSFRIINALYPLALEVRRLLTGSHITREPFEGRLDLAVLPLDSGTSLPRRLQGRH